MHLLIADDESPARDELRYLLGEFLPDATFYEATDGEQVLSIVAREPIEVVFLDINMPGLDGLATATALLYTPSPPLVVFATAYDEHAVRAFELSALDYVVKPFDERRLAKTVERLRHTLQGRDEKPSRLAQHHDLLRAYLQGAKKETMAPATFGKYVVTDLLGTGGMAEVYAGIHPELGRKVAIKVILPQFSAEPNFEERFRREARLVASLRHAHIVQLYDFDVVDGRHFMVMEYLDEGTLKERLRARDKQKSRMSLLEIANLLEAMADALDYAHSRGAIHRDIKPANILYTAEREPVLTDFGIAKLMEDAARLTATGGVVGSPFYMPPEQATGGEVDARSDQYSLGVVLYEMATGRVPFQGSSAVAVMTQHLHNAPPAPRAVNAALPTAVEAVLLKALAKNPDQRFGSTGELAQAFRQALSAQAMSGDLLNQSDDNARTMHSHPGPTPGSSAGRTVDPNPVDAATLVDAGARTSTSDESAATIKAERAASSAAPPVKPDSTPAPMGESRQAGEPPALPAAGPRQANDERQQLPEKSTEPSTTSSKPAAQNFNVGGIQAGIVNQGGEQTFSGDLTFNLDFGELKAAAPQQQAPGPTASLNSADALDLVAILETLRHAFGGSARVDRFVRLVTQFHDQLESLPSERAGDRQQVVKRVQALLMEMTEAKPDPDMVEIMGTSLQRAVQPLALVDPDLTNMVTRITSWVELMVQPE